MQRVQGIGLVVMLACVALPAMSPAAAQMTWQVFPSTQAEVAAPANTTEVQRGGRQQQRVTFTMRDSTVAYTIRALARQATVRLSFNDNNPLFAKRVRVRVKNVTVMDAFAAVLRGTGLAAEFAADGETIVVRPASEGKTGGATDTATGVIRGRVVDSASGRGLSGATVKVQGTKLVTLTDDNGDFVVREVPAGDRVIVVRLFGFHQVARSVSLGDNGSATVRIVMTSVPTVLSGVVTTAAGTQRKLEVGNDITVLNVDSIRQTAPITSVTDLLESRVPGLTVLRSSGVPGDPARIRLRGAGSINGNNDPIVIVDGVRVYAAQSDQRTANLAGAVSQTPLVSILTGNNYAAPSPLDQIDPNSIETIEVQKGPSASSLYGSDAANGVIVITTKKGRAGPARVSATVSEGLSYLPGDYPERVLRWGHSTNEGGVLSNTSDGVLNLSAYLCDITAPCNVFDSVTHLQILNLPRWSPFGHGSSTNGSLSVSGGVASLTYALTGSAGTNLGYLKLPDAIADAFKAYHGYTAPGWARRPDKYTTWGGSGQLSATVSPKMTLTFNSNIFRSQQQRSSLERQLPAFASITDTILAFHPTTESSLLTLNVYERATAERLTFTNAVQGSWSPAPWLPLAGVAGLNIMTGHDITLVPRNMALVQWQPLDTLGRYGVAQTSTTQQTLELRKVAEGHGKLRTSLGFTLNTQSTSDLSGHKDTLALGVNTAPTLDAGTIQSVSRTATYGWFFEPRVMLSERFFLTPGFRLDGGSANGRSASVSGLPNKLTFAALFPKVNFSWVAVDRQEGAAAPVLGMLTLLRPRLALGSAGVQPAARDQLRLLGSPGIGGGGITSGNTNAGNDSLSVVSLGNTKLRPEKANEIEAGFEAELWHGRVNLDVTRARKMQHDAIVSVPVAASVNGGGTIQLNIGAVRNTSIEMSASVRPVELPQVSWTVGGNMAHNENKVVRLDPTSQAFYQNFSASVPTILTPRIVVGYPLFGRWAQPILGYGDANGDGIIQASEIRVGDTALYLGRQDPATTAAINTDLAFLHGQLGIHANFRYTGAYSQVGAVGAGVLNTSTMLLSAANEPNATFGQQAAFVAAESGLTPAGLVQTVHAWEFQSLSVNVAVPSSLARHFHTRHMSIALQGSNIGLWTNYRGKDPNVNALPNGNAVADVGLLPAPRAWSLSFTLGN